MKPVNRNLADEFHEESQEGVDAVLDRMCKVVGQDWGGYGEIIDVSPNTIKTWRRRGSVSSKFLQGFAEKYGTTIDYLMYGDLKRGDAPLTLNKAERELVLKFRAAPGALREAVVRVLDGGPAAGPVQRVKKNTGINTQSGSVTINRGGKR